MTERFEATPRRARACSDSGCVVATQALPADVVANLGARFDLHLVPDGLRPPRRVDQLARLSPAALVVGPGDQVDGHVLTKLQATLKGVVTYSAGTDHIDLDAAAAAGVVVRNVAGLSATSTAEVTLYLMLAAARRTREAARALRTQRWQGWAPDRFLGTELAGRRLGVLGMGSIGRRVAAIAEAFGMDVRYTNPRPVDAAPARFVADFDALLAVSDVLTIHCPLTPATRDLLDEKRLRRLPKGAILINTARGEILDEAALLRVLEDGHVAAAGLDVFRNEPNVDAQLLAHPRITALPHIGSATHRTRSAMGAVVARHLEELLADRGARIVEAAAEGCVVPVHPTSPGASRA